MKRSTFKKRIKRVLSDYLVDEAGDTGKDRWLSTATDRIMKVIERAELTPPFFYDQNDEPYVKGWESEDG